MIEKSISSDMGTVFYMNIHAIFNLDYNSMQK